MTQNAIEAEARPSESLAGAATALIGAIISIVGAALLLAIWHDASTFAAIEGSGGLAEVFTLPVLLAVPGALLGTLGGLFGGTIRRLVAHSRFSDRGASTPKAG